MDRGVYASRTADARINLINYRQHLPTTWLDRDGLPSNLITSIPGEENVIRDLIFDPIEVSQRSFFNFKVLMKIYNL